MIKIRKKQIEFEKLSNIIRIKVKAEGEGTFIAETKDVGYVGVVLKNVEIDFIENARKNLASAMGQRKRPSTHKKNEGPFLII